MRNPKPADVDTYLAAQPTEIRTPLLQVRAALRRALPTSVEAIKYGMPAYLIDGRAVASFAGWKTHYALYIVAPALFEAISNDLVGHDTSKGILRFALDEPLPHSVLDHLATWHATPKPPASKPKPPRKRAPPRR
jgi:uncharacterized protein YdhG (YjbR/CyaY superfamily)